MKPPSKHTSPANDCRGVAWDSSSAAVELPPGGLVAVIRACRNTGVHTLFAHRLGNFVAHPARVFVRQRQGGRQQVLHGGREPCCLRLYVHKKMQHVAIQGIDAAGNMYGFVSEEVGKKIISAPTPGSIRWAGVARKPMPWWHRQVATIAHT